MYCQKCGAKLGEDVKFCGSCGHPVGESVRPVLEPASMGNRFLNFFLDRIFAYIGAVIIVVIGALVGRHHPAVMTTFVVIAILFYVLGYYVFFESIWQRTITKWITGTKVVMNDGSKPPFSRILGRTLCRIIPFEAFSFLVDSHPVGWHDRISHTLVVPKEYTSEDVRKIDLSKKKHGSTAVIILVSIFGAFIVFGILATIILASLGAARQKADDSKIQASLSSARTQAELYYAGNHDSYVGVCTSASGIQPLLKTVEQYEMNSSDSYVCNDTASAWAASAPVSGVSDGAGDYSRYICVDSLGTMTSLPRQISRYGQTDCGEGE